MHTNATTTTMKPSIAATTAATVSNVSVAPKTDGKQMSTKQIIDTMLTSENKVVAATLHHAHFVSNNFDSNNDNKYNNSSVTNSGTMSTDIDTRYDNSSNDDSSADNNIGIGPILDIAAYNRFESTLAKLQVYASDIVRVDKQAIGTGGFAKVYKVMLKGNQLCAAKVSVLLLIL
jgi:hypothetical protein